MKGIQLVFGVLLFMVALAPASMAGTGTFGRTFVSSAGNDANSCAIATPCRTFARAIAQTEPGGEVLVVNSAGYGPVTINQAVTIISPPGIYVGITVTNTTGVGTSTSDGIDIAAGPSDIVTLKGLSIVGPGSSVSTGNGIFFETGGALHVEGCTIQGFVSDIVSEATGQIFVKNTVLKDSNNGLALISTTAGPLVVSMDHVALNDNINGITADSSISGAGAINVAVRESTISGNVTGVSVKNSASGGTASVDLESCLIADGGTGIKTAGTTPVVSISNCLISHNSTAGVSGVAGSFLSRDNNTFNGNGPNVGTIAPLAAQ
jgi:hypothetical protein